VLTSPDRRPEEYHEGYERMDFERSFSKYDKNIKSATKKLKIGYHGYL
jgi:hypothetical protein